MIKYSAKSRWKLLNIQYKKSWSSLSSLMMSQREMAFINRFLHGHKPTKILDIGIGTGRILENLVLNSQKNAEIYGIDYIDEMISYCKKKFKKNAKIKELTVCDISEENLNTGDKFDFITAIRVLQYNRNWKEILRKVYSKLDDGGFFIFSLPNYDSITRFVPSYVLSDKITMNKLRHILKEIGFEVIEIRSVTKIPDFFYQRLFSNNLLYAKLLILLEELLELVLGKSFLGRILFVAVLKNVHE